MVSTCEAKTEKNTVKWEPFSILGATCSNCDTFIGACQVRRHCRMCGQYTCWQCLHEEYVQVEASSKPQLVCKKCHSQSTKVEEPAKVKVSARISAINTSTAVATECRVPVRVANPPCKVDNKSDAVTAQGNSKNSVQTDGKEGGSGARNGYAADYGLDAELKAAAVAKFDGAFEEQAAQWIEACVGGKVRGNFAKALRSGELLCNLLNHIKAGTVINVNKAGMPFKERENVSNFLKGCRSFGVQEHSLFSTDDLYEERNLISVVNCLHALGGAVQAKVPSFKGPYLGVADTSNAKRDGKREIGPATQTGGFHGAIERTQIDFSKDVLKNVAPAIEMQSASASVVAAARTPTASPRQLETSASTSAASPRPRTVGQDQQAMSSAGSTAAPKADSKCNLQAPKADNKCTKGGHSCHASLPQYGLDAELKAAAMSKFDGNLEKQAAAWIQACIGAQVEQDFAQALRNGQILCNLLNHIKPGTVAKVNTANMPFKERENVSSFLRGCRTLGVQEHALFSTDDLYDQKNMVSVVNCLHALGGAVQRSVPSFKGPHLGIADTSNAKREGKRDVGPATQTGGFHGALERTEIDVRNNIVKF